MQPTDRDPKPTPCYVAHMSEWNDNQLLNFIASTVETLRVRIDTIREQMATKVDLANLRDELREEMATKVDLARAENEMATLARAENQMATKDGLARLEIAMQGEFEQVHMRIYSIDRGISSRVDLVEAELGHMRSVLLLAGQGRAQYAAATGPDQPA